MTRFHQRMTVNPSSLDAGDIGRQNQALVITVNHHLGDKQTEQASLTPGYTREGQRNLTLHLWKIFEDYISLQTSGFQVTC